MTCHGSAHRATDFFPKRHELQMTDESSSIAVALLSKVPKHFDAHPRSSAVISSYQLESIGDSSHLLRDHFGKYLSKFFEHDFHLANDLNEVPSGRPQLAAIPPASASAGSLPFRAGASRTPLLPRECLPAPQCHCKTYFHLLRCASASRQYELQWVNHVVRYCPAPSGLMLREGELWRSFPARLARSAVTKLGPGAGEDSFVGEKEMIKDLMNKLRFTDDAELSMGVKADDTEEKFGTAVRETLDDLDNNHATENGESETAVQDALDELSKNPVTMNDDLDQSRRGGEVVFAGRATERDFREDA